MDRATAVHETFTRLAPRYEQAMDQELGQFLSTTYGQFIERLLDLAPVGADDLVLDLATGTARIPRELVDRSLAGGGIVGLDITPAMLEQARDKCSIGRYAQIVHLVCASGTAVAFAADTFDAVLCGFGAHHMDLPGMLCETRRVLKDGGWLVLVEAGAPAFWRSWWGKVFLGCALHVYGLFVGGARARAEMGAVADLHTADEWRALLSDAGFTNVEMCEERARRAGHPRVLTLRAVAG